MTPVSKNVYFNVLDDIVAEYNNTYHRNSYHTVGIVPTIPIKMKPIDAKSNFYMPNTMTNLTKKILNLKKVIM